MTEGKSTTSTGAKKAAEVVVEEKAAEGAAAAGKTAQDKIAKDQVAEDKIAITVSGITIHVWKDMLDDLELLEDLIAIEEGDSFASISALKRVLGSEYELVKDALRDERGIVKAIDAAVFFFALLNEVKAKN